MVDRIEITGMKFFGCHGCHEEEKKTGQFFMVDVALYLNLSAAGTDDDLSKTVDYAKAAEDVRMIVEGESVDLIETVAEKIAGTLLQKYALLERVCVTVQKPLTGISGANASVTIRRMRK